MLDQLRAGHYLLGLRWLKFIRVIRTIILATVMEAGADGWLLVAEQAKLDGLANGQRLEAVAQLELKIDALAVL